MPSELHATVKNRGMQTWSASWHLGSWMQHLLGHKREGRLIYRAAHPTMGTGGDDASTAFGRETGYAAKERPGLREAAVVLTENSGYDQLGGRGAAVNCREAGHGLRNAPYRVSMPSIGTGTGCCRRRRPACSGHRPSEIRGLKRPRVSAQCTVVGATSTTAASSRDDLVLPQY